AIPLIAGFQIGLMPQFRLLTGTGPAPKSAPAYRLPDRKEKLGSNLGPATAKLGPKPCTMT
ncbi:MAG: hypothetical protein WCE52_11345, partial [Candidatus Acidiferrum sp.]